MRRSSLVRVGTVLTALATTTMLLAGCAGGTGSTTDTSAVTTGLVGEQADGGDPTSGGTLSYATFVGISSLDPANRQDSGATGGSEMAAIYDLLIRYDTEAEAFVPQLAQSLEANGDNTVWTLKLRPDIKFSDGTPVDADAVQWSINRYVEKNGLQTQVWKASVADVTSVDPSTVVFTLKRPWNDFPIMLTSGPGMVVSPSSIATGTFVAVGAGPFVVDKFASQEELVLTANPTYWKGQPHLAKLRFPVIQGEQAKLEALHSGGIDAAYIRRAEAVHSALAAGDIGYVHTVSLGTVGVINQREGRAASDERVRKAIVAAINPEIYNDRVEDGYGMPGSDMFQSWSAWHGNVAASGYDPEAAKRYLAEARADGYDGKLTYVGSNTPETQRNALAYQSMLQAVGFTVEISYAPSNTDLVRRLFVEHDYDVAHSGLSVLEESPFVRLFVNFHSDSPSNVLGYKNAEMDQLLTQLQTAFTDDDRRAVLERMQTLVNDTAPLATIGAGKVLVTWRQNVHGVTPSADGIMLFQDAWLASEPLA
ncbi:ABC transporter substrate-binding protein [Prescottella defluvii]|uniref:ABC transporter substrate-binding protein n=1 Tax=Prescottella defluvii TaxID=1323361 RepID=UPI0004F274B4|nr:ABC transporter substrate-binding protein [Prescottella defluvii]